MVGQIKYFIKIYKVVRKIFLVIISGIAIYIVMALLFSFLPTHPPSQNCIPEKEIYITSNGVHLDIIIPVDNAGGNLLHRLEILPGTKYVAFGWGDKDFYVNTPEWSDLSLPVTFKALFLKSTTAMHVTCFMRSYSSWKKINLCSWQLNSLNCYIENSFKKDKNGQFYRLIFPGYTNHDFFFEAHDSFSIFKTCNVWTNKALKKIGIKTSVWSPFDFGVIYHLNKQQPG